MTTQPVNVKQVLRARLADVNRQLKPLIAEKAELEIALAALSENLVTAPRNRNEIEMCMCGPKEDCVICKWGF